jgi:light-regulated signal transduction histidine kinase (bacteriophytochrome)
VLLVQADRILPTQLLENRLRNAWKYRSLMPSAPIEVGKTASAGAVVFFVRENGTGRATTLRIVTRHAASIWAEIKVDEGATFYFTIP